MRPSVSRAWRWAMRRPPGPYGALPDLALAVAVDQDGGGATVDAQLALQAGAPDVVARPQAAVLLHQAARHHEQRQALHAFGRFRGPRQHQVHDVLGQVMLAVGDEDLLAAEAVAAVLLPPGQGAQLIKV